LADRTFAPRFIKNFLSVVLRETEATIPAKITLNVATGVYVQARRAKRNWGVYAFVARAG